MKTTRTPQFSKPARKMDRMAERQNKDIMDKDRYRGRLEWDLPSLQKRADAVYQERRREKRCFWDGKFLIFQILNSTTL